MAVSGFGTIYVQLNKGNYTPGEQINGVVYLNVEVDYPGHCEVRLNISGLEDTKLIERWTETKSSTDSEGNSTTEYETRYTDHHEINTFFNYSFPIYKFSTSYVPAGNYTFPICFVLQKGIPSTFFYEFVQYNTKCHAKVNYSIKA